jgi:regulatory protein
LVYRTKSGTAIQKTLDYLKSVRLLDDRQFTRQWIETRLAKSFGLKRITFELKEKGIDEQIITEEFLRLKNDYSEEKTVRQIIQEYREKHKTMEKEILRQKLNGYLANRGFEEELIQEILRTL